MKNYLFCGKQLSFSFRVYEQTVFKAYVKPAFAATGLNSNKRPTFVFKKCKYNQNQRNVKVKQYLINIYLNSKTICRLLSFL